MDFKNADEFIKWFDERVLKILKENMNFNRCVSATVESVGTGVATIKPQGWKNSIPNVKNKTGETLSVGDEVLVLAINGSLNNIVIFIKK